MLEHHQSDHLYAGPPHVVGLRCRRELDTAVLLCVSWWDVESSGILDSRALTCFLNPSTSTLCRSLRAFGKELNGCGPLKHGLLQYMVLTLDETAGTLLKDFKIHSPHATSSVTKFPSTWKFGSSYSSSQTHNNMITNQTF